MNIEGLPDESINMQHRSYLDGAAAADDLWTWSTGHRLGACAECITKPWLYVQRACRLAGGPSLPSS